MAKPIRERQSFALDSWKKEPMVCVQCGSIGAEVGTAFNVFVFLILCLFFLVPGLIYAVWANSVKSIRCKRCGSDDVIPLNSPRGATLHKQYYPDAEPVQAAPQKKTGSSADLGCLGLVVIAMLVFPLVEFFYRSWPPQPESRGAGAPRLTNSVPTNNPPPSQRGKSPGVNPP